MKRVASTFGRGDLTASLILIFPLYLAYAIGVVFSGSINGVDLVSRQLWRLCGADRTTYLLVHAVIAAAFVVWVRRARRTRSLSLDVVGPVIAEAAVYALTMGSVIRLVLEHVLARGGLLSLGPTAHHVIASLGAGVHEELVFRLGLLCGLAWALRRGGVGSGLALAVAVIASALVFSWAHHLAGEPWDRAVFAYRALAGVVFALICWYRSLAHAVYAHALYDLWVLVLRP